MKRLRLVLLVLLALFVLMVVFSDPPPVEIAAGSTLVLEVEGSYVEGSTAPLLDRLLGDGRKSFTGFVSGFNMAIRDDRVARVVVVIRPFDMGWAKIAEVRDAIARLREAGKPTYAFLELASFSAGREYYLATAADEIHVIPGGSVPLVGLAAEYFFLGGLFEKLEIDWDVAKAGRYKSAVESFTQEGMSPAAREMADSLLDDLNSSFIEAIATGRDLDAAKVRELVDLGLILPEELESHGLVDGVGHLQPLLDRVGGAVVRGETFAGVTLEDVGVDARAEIALVYGVGNVVGGEGTVGETVFAAEAASEAILDAADDPEIDAIILRIDSPGGSALASEQIHEAMTRARAKGKPIIASFSDVAASGGYYAATGADFIVSGANTLTGSIGVFALRPVLGDLLARIGVSIVPLTRGKHADFLLASEPLSPAALAILDRSVQQTYMLFLERVATAREMDVADVDGVAQGRVWSGRQAFERGLVDELGGLHAAVGLAKRELGLDASDDAVLVPFPAPPSFSEQLVDLMKTQARAMGAAMLPVPESVRRLEALVSQLPAGQPLLVPPMLIEIR